MPSRHISEYSTAKTKGFTLIELLVAMGIVVILGVPLLGMFTSTFGQSLRAQILTEETYIASGVLDIARSYLYQADSSYDLSNATVFSGSTEASTLDRIKYNIPDGYEVTLIITKALSGEDDLFRLTVQVARGNVTIDMETLVYDE